MAGATLFTNALPIAAGTTLFVEGLGSLPVVRALAFACTRVGSGAARAARGSRTAARLVAGGTADTI